MFVDHGSHTYQRDLTNRLLSLQDEHAKVLQEKAKMVEEVQEYKKQIKDLLHGLKRCKCGSGAAHMKAKKTKKAERAVWRASADSDSDTTSGADSGSEWNPDEASDSASEPESGAAAESESMKWHWLLERPRS